MELASPKVGLVSLGCPKALVDSERIVTRLRAEGYQIVGDYAGADLVLVNTCGFLDSARAESLAAIGEALAENGRVVVTGCLGKEADLIHDALPPAHDAFQDLVPEAGLRLTPRHYAYLKISEGCNNRCSFCIIPHLRGDLVSRPLAQVMFEAEALTRAGVKELLVISQDTSAYGQDLKYAASNWKGREYQTRFLDLAEALGSLGVWVRMHYVYPYPHVDHVLPLMADGKILPYLDIPFQHASPRVLKAMRRPANQEKVLERLAAWRKIVPDLAIRSTFIVGFPGETDDDFDDLLDWLEEAQIDRLGCFQYEPVAGAPSNALPGAVPDDVKQERYDRLMELQQAISAEKQIAKIGREYDVIIDDVDEDEATGRTYADAPDIDGNVYLDGENELEIGEIVRVRVTDADAYDLWGEGVE